MRLNKRTCFAWMPLLVILGNLPLFAQQQTNPNTQQQLQNPSFNQQSLSQYNISPAQINSINVDNLSDGQIKMYMDKAQQSGMTQDQLEMALKAKGMPQSEIDKLRNRVNQLMSAAPQGGTGFDRARTRENQLPTTEEDVFNTLTEPFQTREEKELEEKRSKIFGFDLFNNQNLTFEPSMNIATPRDYQLGPGDEVIIDVWGASEQTYQLTISPDGFINIPNLGPIYVNGLPVDEATQRIKGRLSEIYAGIKPRNGQPPNTFAQVTLGQVRTIIVHVIGEAQRPGTYNVSSLSTVANVLYLANGPNVNGSLRDIEIIRNHAVIGSVDIYDFLLKGILKNNIRLEDRDIIRFKPYLNRVTVNGEVKKEGIYETKDDETYEDLLSFTGGFTENAYKKLIKVSRNDGDDKLFLDLTQAELKTTHPRNGDVVTVQGILDRYANRVQVRGAVFREGAYQLTDSLTLTKLIDLAEGLRGDAFLERGNIYRTNKDYSYSVVSFNLRDILKGTSPDIKLQREDMVQIPSIYDIKEEYYVQVFGEVKVPGTYPYFQNMKVEDLILRAGGLLQSASGAQVEIARRITDKQNEGSRKTTAQIITLNIDKSLTLGKDDSKFVIKPFDQVYIRKSPGYQHQISAKVDGEVLYPGLYVIKEKDERISDLVKRAGGLTPEGYAKGATLIRRTEFNPPPTDEQVRLQNLGDLYDNVKKQTSENEYIIGTEAEVLQQKRLKKVDDQLKQKYIGENAQDSVVGKEAMRIRQDRLQSLLKNKTADASQVQFETIGIDLDKILKSPGSKFDIFLQDGDILTIPKQLQTVRMRGEFLYPITVRYDQRLHFKNYVSKAGGFTEQARRGKSYVLYANGAVDRTKNFMFVRNYPKIEPGTEIIVPQKPPKKMSPQAWVGIGSSLAALAFTITLIMNNLKL